MKGSLRLRASVDLETDNKIQRTIQTQFKENTLLCIAREFSTTFDDSKLTPRRSTEDDYIVRQDSGYVHIRPFNFASLIILEVLEAGNIAVGSMSLLTFKV